MLRRLSRIHLFGGSRSCPRQTLLCSRKASRSTIPNSSITLSSMSSRNLISTRFLLVGFVAKGAGTVGSSEGGDGADDALWLNFEPERRGWFVDRNVLDSCDEGGSAPSKTCRTASGWSSKPESEASAPTQQGPVVRCKPSASSRCSPRNSLMIRASCFGQLAMKDRNISESSAGYCLHQSDSHKSMTSPAGVPAAMASANGSAKPALM